MKIILINPPSPFLIDQKVFPPLGILYLASYLSRFDYKIEIMDLAEKEGELEKTFTFPSSAVYGISSTTAQYYWAKIIKDQIKKKNPDAIVCIGGSHASCDARGCIEDGFDFVIAGEGENSFLNLLRSIEKGRNPEVRILKSEYIRDLDTLPFPAREKINIMDYGYDIEGESATTIITSRGCPFECAFCSKSVWGNSVRFNSVDYVIGEIKKIISDFGFRHFLFLDDAFCSDKSRLFKMCARLKDLDIKWRCYARSNSTTKEMLKAIKDAGCIEIGVGVESGSQKILDLIDKGTTVQDNTRFVKECKNIGLMVNAFIMIGLPGENIQTVEETKRWMREVQPHKFGFNIFVPYKDSKIYNNLHNYDLQVHAMPEEKSWVKGRQGEYEAFVSTTQLKQKEILKLFDELFEYYTELLNWKPGVGFIKNQPIRRTPV